MSQLIIPESVFQSLRNRLFRRVVIITLPGATVVAFILSIAAGLQGWQLLQSVLVILPPVLAFSAGAFEFVTVTILARKAFTERPGDQEGDRLRRILELPRRIEVYLYTLGWFLGATSYALLVCWLYQRSFWVVSIGPLTGVFAALFLGPILTHQTENDVRELAIAEFHRNPAVALRSSGGLFWVRQSWYLPYAFSIALLSMFVFCAIILTTQFRQLAQQIAEAVRGGALAATPDAIAEKLSGLAWSAGIPVVCIAAILLVAFGILGTMLARRQSMSASAVERALETIAAGSPELPRWIASDETGDLARATGRISSEIQRVFVQLRAMAGGDLSQELRGESGLMAAFRDSQSAMLQLARMMIALSRGEVSAGERIPGDLGTHFEQLQTSFRAIVDQAQTIAQGDLRTDVAVPGALGEAIQRMTANLRTMVGQTQRVSGDIGDIVVNLQTTVNQLSSATTEQVAAVTETANTMTEMAQTSAVSADRAADLIKQGEAAAAVVEEGLEAAESTVQAILAIAASLSKVSGASQALAERVKKIDTIIETVGFLADQSSTLAINAAIEATRAGDAGKGFTVVAREIRTLASDSRKAASQIREILGEITNRTREVDGSVVAGNQTVENGSRLVKRLEEVVNQLGVTVHEAVGLMRQVEGSARQQQAGVGQVTQALTNLQRASESIRDGARLLGTLSGKAHELSTSLQKTSGSYSLPAASA